MKKFLLVLLALLICTPASAQSSKWTNHWVVIMGFGEKASEIDSKKETELKRAHLRYLGEFEENGKIKVTSGFRVHEDEPHRELAIYSSDLKREEVQKIAEGSPIVEAGLWKPYVYIWTTSKEDVSFGAPPEPEPSEN